MSRILFELDLAGPPANLATAATAGRIEAQMTVPSSVSITATNSGGGPTTIPITAGAYYPSDLVAHLQAQLNATRTPTGWTVTLDTATGLVSINWVSGGGGTYSVAWTANGATLRDVLGFTGDFSGITQGNATSGSKQCRGLWIPDHPINLDASTGRAPKVSDALACVSPRGDQTTLVGNTFYRHTGVIWSHVAESRVWEAKATTVNASWETFWTDAYLGQGSISWFSPGSKLRIYDHTDTQLGIDANGGAGVSGWTASKGPMSIEPKKAVGSWTGLWTIQIPELISSG